MACFVITSFFYTPSLLDENEWQRFISKKVDKFCPWIFDKEHQVLLSGLGAGWRGWQRKGNIVAHAMFKGRRWNFLNAFLAWITHFIDIVRSCRSSNVIVVTNSGGGLMSAVLRIWFRARLRLVVRVEGESSSYALVKNSLFSKAEYTIRSIFEKFVINRADIVVANSEFTKGFAFACGANSSKVFVVMSKPKWEPLLEPAELPPNLNVLFVGRLVKAKGVQDLVDSFLYVYKEIPESRLLIVGDGPYRNQLRRAIKEIGLESCVQLLGGLDGTQLRKAYLEAQVVVLPSLWQEGWSQALTEAAAMGRPLIASSIGALGEIVRDGENGFLVPPGDIVGLANAIIKVLKDENLRNKMGLASHRIAREWFKHREKAVEEVEERIRKLARELG